MVAEQKTVQKRRSQAQKVGRIKYTLQLVKLKLCHVAQDLPPLVPRVLQIIHENLLCVMGEDSQINE